MASIGEPELEEAPVSFRSVVWEHFGFPVNYNGDCQQVVDKISTICRLCSLPIDYSSGNTSNMTTHLRRHHPKVPIGGTTQKK